MRIRPWKNHLKSLEKEGSAKTWETLLTRDRGERKKIPTDIFEVIKTNGNEYRRLEKPRKLLSTVYYEFYLKLRIEAQHNSG